MRPPNITSLKAVVLLNYTYQKQIISVLLCMLYMQHIGARMTVEQNHGVHLMWTLFAILHL